jgi:hypothetical protein
MEDLMNDTQVNELLLQSLEHEIGGMQVYATALKCALNENLKEEWEAYLEQTQRHVEVMTRTCMAVGLDPTESSPGREIVRKLGQSLVAAMEEALQKGRRTSLSLKGLVPRTLDPIARDEGHLATT